jgi:hypothetical protein
MNDYLANIAAKALNLALVIQPRPASMFEPAPGMDEFSAGHVPASDNVPDETHSQATVASVSFTHRPSGQRQAIERLTESTRPVTPDATPVDAIQASWSGQLHPPQHTPQTGTLGPRLDDSHLSPSVLAPQVPSSARVVDTGLSITPSRGQPAVVREVAGMVDRPSPNGGEAEAAPVFEPATSPLVALSHAISSQTPSQAAHQSETTAPPSLPQRPAAVKIMAQPYVVPAAEPIAPTAVELTTESASAPIIRVHIGRVEVRAILPAAPPTPRSRPARPSAGLSLDEYLKPRQRGQR